MNTSDEAIAQAVCSAMTTKGVSQVALSEATGIPRATLIRRLRGFTPFTVPELSRIAHHLGLEITDFLAAA